MQGINGFDFFTPADTIGTVTTVPNGGSVYAQGPGAAVGTTGFLWAPQGNGITGGGAAVGGVSTNMTYTGVFGPGGGLDLTSPAFASQFVGGIATLPLAELLIKGDVRVESTFSLGEYLTLGQATYAPPPAYGAISFSGVNFPVPFALVPEPSSVILAALAMLSVLVFRQTPCAVLAL